MLIYKFLRLYDDIWQLNLALQGHMTIKMS